eukprot:354762-Chlamydomonas_euryale.AAC.3
MHRWQRLCRDECSWKAGHAAMCTCVCRPCACCNCNAGISPCITRAIAATATAAPWRRSHKSVRERRLKLRHFRVFCHQRLQAVTATTARAAAVGSASLTRLLLLLLVLLLLWLGV